MPWGLGKCLSGRAGGSILAGILGSLLALCTRSLLAVLGAPSVVQGIEVHAKQGSY